MQDKINLLEILDRVPIGTHFYSPLFGECTLLSVHKDSDQIVLKVPTNENGGNEAYHLNGDGTYDKRGECMLFPSKLAYQCEDYPWQNYARGLEKFEPFQKVLTISESESETPRYRCDFYSHFSPEGKYHVCVSGLHFLDGNIIPYEGNEDKVGHTKRFEP